jgi:hypothetical protein
MNDTVWYKYECGGGCRWTTIHEVTDAKEQKCNFSGCGCGTNIKLKGQTQDRHEAYVWFRRHQDIPFEYFIHSQFGSTGPNKPIYRFRAGEWIGNVFAIGDDSNWRPAVRSIESKGFIRITRAEARKRFPKAFRQGVLDRTEVLDNIARIEIQPLFVVLDKDTGHSSYKLKS